MGKWPYCLVRVSGGTKDKGSKSQHKIQSEAPKAVRCQQLILQAASATKLVPNILHFTPLDPASKVEGGPCCLGSTGTPYHLPRPAPWKGHFSLTRWREQNTETSVMSYKSKFNWHRNRKLQVVFNGQRGNCVPKVSCCPPQAEQSSDNKVLTYHRLRLQWVPRVLLNLTSSLYNMQQAKSNERHHQRCQLFISQAGL